MLLTAVMPLMPAHAMNNRTSKVWPTLWNTLSSKGTHKRKAWHILNRMENVGGDLNAYTNKEETVVYGAFLKEHFSRAAELLTDIVFHSTYPQQEIDKEVEVIIDEIQSYEDKSG